MSTNKRQVKKKVFASNQQESKKVATGDPNEEKKVSGGVSNGITIKTKKLQLEIIENVVENQKKELAELQEKTTQMQNQLSSLKSEYESQKEGCIQDVNKYNNDLEQKNEILLQLSKENNQLINNLKKIEKDFNKKYTKFMEKKLVKHKKEIKRTEQVVKNDINVKLNEIKNVKKLTEATKAQQKKYEDLLNNVNDGLEENVKCEHKEINEQIAQLKKEIKELSSIKLEHNNCIKEIQNLTSSLNIINNEIEFETKKSDMISTMRSSNNVMNNEESNASKNESQILKIQNELVANKLNYGSKVRDIILKKGRTPKKDKINKSALNYIQTEINSIKKKSHKKLTGSINEAVSLIDNSYVKDPNLFSDREIEVLKKVIPEDYLEVYNERYEMKKNENKEIEKKFEEHDGIKFENQQIKYDIDSIKMKIKEQERRQADIMIKFRNNKKQILNLKSEIGKYEKSLNKELANLKRLNEIIKKSNYDYENRKLEKIK